MSWSSRRDTRRPLGGTIAFASFAYPLRPPR
jgi:hypothetical protein